MGVKRQKKDFFKPGNSLLKKKKTFNNFKIMPLSHEMLCFRTIKNIPIKYDNKTRAQKNVIHLNIKKDKLYKWFEWWQRGSTF